MINAMIILIVFLIDMILRLLKINFNTTIGYNSDTLFLQIMIMIEIVVYSYNIYKFNKVAISLYGVSIFIFVSFFLIGVYDVNIWSSIKAIIFTYIYGAIVIMYMLYKFKSKKA